jgi:hypothetical protein
VYHLTVGHALNYLVKSGELSCISCLRFFSVIGRVLHRRRHLLQVLPLRVLHQLPDGTNVAQTHPWWRGWRSNRRVLHRRRHLLQVLHLLLDGSDGGTQARTRTRDGRGNRRVQTAAHGTSHLGGKRTVRER